MLPLDAPIPLSRRRRRWIAHSVAWPLAALLLVGIAMFSSLLALKLAGSAFVLGLAGALVYITTRKPAPTSPRSNATGNDAAPPAAVGSTGNAVLASRVQSGLAVAASQGSGKTPVPVVGSPPKRVSTPPSQPPYPPGHNALADSGPVSVAELSRTGIHTLQRTHDEWQQLIHNLPHNLLTTDERGTVLFLHRSSDNENIGIRIGSAVDNLVRNEHQSLFRDARERAVNGRKIQQVQCLRSGMEDTNAWWSLEIVPMVHADGTNRLLIMATDITQQKDMEEKMRQGQRMEAIGRLSSGVGHDFNNILTVIQCNALLIQDMLGKNDKAYPEVEEIIESVERATRLTHQLLAFSRTQEVRPKALELNRLTSNLLRMLQRLLGENIQVKFNGDGILPMIHADETQIEQILMNLIVNARDAMPQGGNLTLRTGLKVFNDTFTHLHGTLAPGEYVLFQITDTGEGIAADTLPRIFEPYFTTKKSGRGYGLGLSTVYGIVSRYQGGITCTSTLNFGTTFTIYLPVATGPIAGEQSHRISGGDLTTRPSSTILLVEDEAQVRNVAQRVLDRQKYLVLCAETPDQALEIARTFEGEIDLLFTDIVMPERNGAELAHDIVKLRPKIKVLFTSGYTDSVALAHGIEPSAIYFLPKPYTAGELLRKINEILVTSMVLEPG